MKTLFARETCTHRSRQAASFWSAAAVALATTALATQGVGAQAPAPAPVEATPPAAPVAAETLPPPAAPPPPMPMPMPTTSVGAMPPAAPTEEATTPPPTPMPEAKPMLHVAAWLRMGARAESGTQPKKLNDQRLDTMYGELHADGNITKWVSLTLNLNANGLAGTAGIEDAIIGFDFVDEFHLWIGQMLVPSDRANFGGPFFMIPWNYPGFLTVGKNTVTIAPKEGPYGRNQGFTVWGDIDGGMFKYMVGAYDFGDVSQGLLFSGRLVADLIGKEPGYFGNASYFGAQDILAVGVGGQYQRKGSIGLPPAMGTAAMAPVDNYGEFNADVLGEFKLGKSGGWFTLDASYYHFVGDYQEVKDGFYALLAVASPVVGIGNIQPMVRIQYGHGDNTKVWCLDAFVSYLIKGPALRLTAGWEHTDIGNNQVANALQAGAQAIFF